MVECIRYKSNAIEKIEASVESLRFLFNACSREASGHDVKLKCYEHVEAQFR